MPEKIWNSKLFQWLLSVIASVIIVIMTQSLISKREYNNVLKNDIEKKASIEYVDKQDSHIINKLDQHIREADRQIEAQTELIRSIDGNVKILLSKQK